MQEDTSVIDALGGVTYYHYSGEYVESVKDPLGRVTTHQERASDTDASGYTTYFL